MNLALLISAFLAASPAPADSRLSRVLSLGREVRVLQGPIRTYYTPPYEERARSVQALLEREREFYREKLGVQVELSLAVLDKAQWGRVAREVPYGLPSISDPPYVAVMPAEWKHTVVGFFPPEGSVTKQERASLERGADAIGAHELGHTLYKSYGIDPKARWLHELLAQLAVTGFLRAFDPALLKDWRAFIALGKRYPHPHTSLEDLESHYLFIMRESPANYAWYQSMFEARAEAILDREGIDFFKKLRAAFPAQDSERLSSEEVLARLDSISSGWHAWAKAMALQGR